MTGGRVPLLAALLLAALVAAVPPPRPAAAEDPPVAEPATPTDPDDPEAQAAPLDARIKVAIERGVAFVKSQQAPNGTWRDFQYKGKSYGGDTEVYQYPLGATAWALYTLLKCGVPVDDPVVKKGFAWLKAQRITDGVTAYEVSASLLAVTAVADPFKKGKDSDAAGAKVRLTGDWRTWAAALQTTLVARRAPRGWRYQKGLVVPGGFEDVSSTQLALLALAAAERCGIATDPQVYASAAAYVLTLQETEGPEADRAIKPRAAPSAKRPADAGRYGPTPPAAPPPVKDRARGFRYTVEKSATEEDRTATGARTACGIGSLVIARYALSTASEKASRKVTAPPAAAVEQAIYDGLAWSAENWSPWSNPSAHGRPIYYLYCVERALDLLHAARLGEHLWYVEMVEQLLSRQEEHGSWDSHDGQLGQRGPLIDTCYALLFLRRSTLGGVPVPTVTEGNGGK